MILVATRSVVQDVGIGYTAAPPGKPRTLAEKKIIARKMIEMTFDPSWIEANGPRLNSLLERALTSIKYVQL